MAETERSAKDLVLEGLRAVFARGGSPAAIVRRLLSTEKDRPPAETVRIVERLYTIIRLRRRIDFALLREDASEAAPDPLSYWLALHVLEGAIPIEDAAPEVPGVDWSRVASWRERLSGVDDPLRRFAILHSLPDRIAAHLIEEYGPEAPALAEALNRHPPVTIRANSLKTTREALAAALLGKGVTTRPAAGTSMALMVDTPAHLFRLPEFAVGLFEPQDEGSQIVADLVAPPPEGWIVDLCAGAGGKTLALAALLHGKGRILALDTSEARIQELKRRARRAGAHQIKAAVIPDGPLDETVSRILKDADRILIDAPCSGIGAIRRKPDARWRIDDARFTELPERQYALLAKAAALLKPGARLIYATCTTRRAENEAVVERILAGDPALEPVRVIEVFGRERGAPLADGAGTWLRLLPHRHGTDAFFAAVIRRKRIRAEGGGAPSTGPPKT